MPQHNRSSRALYLAYTGLFILLIVAVTVRVRSSDDVIHGLLRGEQQAKLPITLRDPHFEVVNMDAPAAAAGVQRGDVLKEVNGKPYRGASDLYGPMRFANAGDRMRLQLERQTGTGAAPIDVDVSLSAAPATTTRDWIQSAVADILMPVLCLVLGFWVVAVRIRDPQAWILLFVLLGLGQQGDTRYPLLYGHDDWFQPVVIVFHQALWNGWPIAMTLFGLYFSERLVYDRRWPWAKWILLAPLSLHLAANVTIKVLQAHHAVWAAPLDSLLDPLDRPLFALGLVATCFFFFGTRTKMRMTKNPDVRRRLSLLLSGTALSLAPVFLVIVKDFLFNEPRFETEPEWLEILVLLPTFFFPVTLAYLIVVHRAMDVRVAVRQGLQYLLARGGVLAVQILLVVLIVYAATTVMADEAIIISGSIVGVLLVGRVARWLRAWIDRRFFREAYNAEQILEELAGKVRTMIEATPLMETVAQRIAESLHVSRVAFLLNNGGNFEPAYALGYSEYPAVSLPYDSATARKLGKDQHLRVRLDETAAAERESLEKLQSELLLPLSLNERLLGVLSLGPKQSEEPYSSADIRLLNSVATQTGLALENSRLTAAVATEVAQRERMNRELEIAREVQERLFPQNPPLHSSLDYTGSCRPALVVGGDYYDFIPLSDTSLGVAIGDVSGKGIPAAMLMASLRTSLRSQTIRKEDDLTLLMANVNTLLYEGSTSNRYATFFYAQYDTTSRILTYVNAGHNPPLVFRGKGEVIRLETGGPVVGLLPGFPYQQASVELFAGDVLVAFTDGISEAMNPDDQEWGEDRLIECVWKCRNLDADKMMKGIIAAADEFVDGAEQHDDMTIIVAKLLLAETIMNFRTDRQAV